jgi:hypothetical protein
MLAADQQLQVSLGCRWASQTDFDGLLLPGRQHPPETAEQSSAVPRRQRRGQVRVRPPSPLHPQQLGGGQVHLGDPPLAGQRGIADRGEVAGGDIAVAGLLQGLLRHAQILVLEFHLDLVDLQLIDELLGLRGREGVALRGTQGPDPRLRLPASVALPVCRRGWRVRRLLTWIILARHQCSPSVEPTAQC